MPAESRSEALEARIRQLMAELATYPSTGGIAWQFRETRRRLRNDIEYAFQAWDVARDIEGSDTTIFDGEPAPSE